MNIYPKHLKMILYKNLMKIERKEYVGGKEMNVPQTFKSCYIKT